jgi:16S rRNA (cytosine967-C5)-methyltransferase
VWSLSKEYELAKATVSEPEVKSVRRLVTEILLKVDTRKAYADILLDRALQSMRVSPRDRALTAELLYGTLRWRKRLDAHLRPYMRRPFKDNDPFIRNLLRLTLYQLLFLQRIPAYAAVNDAVELAKAHSGEKTGGFTNGVLRNFLREKRQLPKPDPKKLSISAFAEYWSHPEWLIHRWIDYLGAEQVEALLQANNEAAPLVLRAHLMRGTREALLKVLESEGIEASPTHWSPQGLTVQTGGAIPAIPGFHEGLFQVQGEASQLTSHLLAPKAGERILDACAAPGGKTTHIAELMNDEGEIIAADISEKGLAKVAENIGRLGLKSIQTFQADVSEALVAPINQPYDRVLVDAPCSGLGTLRSHPEIKWNRTQSDIMRLAHLQKRILAQTGSYVKPGGVLVYSTCTLSREENENVVASFLADHNEFALDAAADYLPESAKKMVRGSYFLALPHVHNTDGFFAARMRRTAA